MFLETREEKSWDDNRPVRKRHQQTIQGALGVAKMDKNGELFHLQNSRF